MFKRNSINTLLLFLLPAFTTMVAYTAFYDKIYTKPACYVNCGNLFSNTESSNPASIKKKLLSTYEMINRFKNELAQDKTYATINRTSTDLAFLQEKLRILRAYYDDININKQSNWASLHQAVKSTDGNQISAKASNSDSNQYIVTASNSSSLVDAYIDNRAKLTLGDKIELADSSIDRPLAKAVAVRNDFPNFNPVPVANAPFSAPSPSSPFVLVATSGIVIDDDFNNPVNAVPLPASIYFMLSSLLMYFGYKRTQGRKLNRLHQ